MGKGVPTSVPVSLVSTFSFKGSHEHGAGWLDQKFTDCTKTPGNYAGCMTAPCYEDENGKVICECPVYNGPYQIGGEGKTCNEMIPSGSFQAQKEPQPPTDETYSIIPTEACKSPVPVCY